MRPETEVRPPRSRSLPELNAEEDVDLRKYWNRLAAHWWLPLLGLVAGALLGYALSLGGGKTYEAKALVYLGNPLSTGGGPITSLSANPRFVSAAVHSEAAIREAARVAGISPAELRGRISSGAVSGGAVLGAAGSARGVQTLVTITVTGHRGARSAKAANALAAYVVRQISRFPNTKIRTFKVLLASNKRELKTVTDRIASLNGAIAARNLDVFQRLVLLIQADNAEQRRGSLLNQQSVARQQLTQAQDIESPRIFPAEALETTAGSARNSALVGAAIGLLLGVLAALLWDRLVPRARRPA